MKSLVRTVVRKVARVVLRGGAVHALGLVLRWGRARAHAARTGRGLVRATGIVWPQFGRVWTVGLDVPRPGRGEVLVRAEASAVSPGTERAFFVQLPNAVASFPAFPGYSLAGAVVEVGRGVGQLRPGDPVALSGPHVSVALARATEIYPVPSGVAMEEAAFIQLGIIALHAFRTGNVRPGQPVVVLGQGLIGQLLAQMAAAFGAHPVISVARSARRLTESLQRVTQRIVLTPEAADALDGLNAAVTFEATGAPDGIPLALRCTGAGGRVVLAGSTRGVTERMDFGLLADSGITLVGAHITSLSNEARPACGQTFLQLLAQRRLDVASLISQRVHPMEAEWFYRRMAGRDDATIGALFCWDRLPSEQRMRRISFVTPPDLTPMRGAVMATVPLASRVRAARS